MSEQVLIDYVEGPLGRFRVSTVRTVAGGARPTVGMIGFSDADFQNGNLWPFETMVFAENSSIGLHHTPHSTEQDARKHHEMIVRAVRDGSEFGGGVEGPDGNPSMTAEQWYARIGQKEATL